MGADRAKRKVRGGSLLGNDWEVDTRAKIQSSKIVNRLIDHVNGLITLESTQVSAAVALMKKVLPDTVFVEHAGEVSSKVIRSPAPSATPSTWASEHIPPHLRPTEH